MRLSLVVETGDGVVDRAFESIGIGDGSIGQIMLLEVAPASFDIVQFGGVFRQPFEGEPSALGERRVVSLPRWIGPLSSTATRGRVRSAVP